MSIFELQYFIFLLVIIITLIYFLYFYCFKHHKSLTVAEIVVTICYKKTLYPHVLTPCLLTHSMDNI